MKCRECQTEMHVVPTMSLDGPMMRCPKCGVETPAHVGHVDPNAVTVPAWHFPAVQAAADHDRQEEEAAREDAGESKSCFTCNCQSRAEARIDELNKRVAAVEAGVAKYNAMLDRFEAALKSVG